MESEERSMKITALSVKNYKRVRDVSITPIADRTIILIGGKNASGKSSTLDALTAAIGGKRAQPTDPVRHGADEATIMVELDGGALTIRRVIQPDGESALEVRDRLGVVKSPQAILDKLVGARFLDPLAFLQLPAKEQRAQLMRMIDGAGRIGELNAKRERVFTKRTEVGRDLEKASGEHDRLPLVEIGTPIDVAELTRATGAHAEQKGEAQRLLADMDKIAARLTTSVAARDEKLARIEKLQREIEQLTVDAASFSATIVTQNTEAATARTALAAADERWIAGKTERDQIATDLARAGDHNRAVFAAEAQMKRRAEAEITVTQLTAERDNLTKVIATIDDRKAEILASAKLPVDGLGVTDDGIELAGVPFAQASAAERHRVALALAIAASPGLDDVWIRDGALLDEESLELVARHARAANKRVWIERVGTSDPGVIVIQDGKVVDPRPIASAPTAEART